MIKTIDNITINGTRQVWGGYIYNLNYQPSFGSSPSYCTASFVSEDGTYSIQQGDLQVFSPHLIKVGNNISLSMFPVNYKINQSSSGKLLEVRYIDTSIILDKRNVVLNGRQGNDGTAHPINPYGTGPTTYPDDEFSGSCYIPVGKELLTADQTYNDVLDVVYTFPQLCDAIATNGIVINSDSYSLIQSSNQFYYASYIGTLRTVLSQWCTDLGYGFYWENDSIHFLDLTTNLILNTSSFDNAVQEANTTEVSIEDTVGRVACAFYGQDRQLLNPLPGQDTKITFKLISTLLLTFSQDEIETLKAAYLGEDFYFTYHMLLNTQYGNDRLGIISRTGYISANNSTQGQQCIPRSTDNSPQVIYQDYVYIAQDKTAYDFQWNYWKKMSDFIGKYYFKPIVYSDYKLISSSERKISFYDQLLLCSQTEIGTFASQLGDGDQQLGQFLINAPYVAGDVTSIYQALPPETEPAYPYDNVNGDMIIDVGQPVWQISPNLDGNFVNLNSDSLSSFIKNNNVTSYFFSYIESVNSNQIASIILPSDQPDNYSQVITSGNSQGASKITPILKMFAVQQPLPGGLLGTQTFNFDGLTGGFLLTPEEIPQKDVNGHIVSNAGELTINVHINNNAQNIQPKVEEFFRSETDKTGNMVTCNSNVIKNELNYRTIGREDLLALGTLTLGFEGGIFTAYGIHLAIPAVPNPTTLEEAFKDFVQNLTWSKSNPTIVKTYSLPYIDLLDNYRPLIGNGLINLQIRMDEKGVNSTYTMGTRLMQVPSLDSIRRNIEFQRGVNQSRFLPYGYQPLPTL